MGYIDRLPGNLDPEWIKDAMQRRMDHYYRLRRNEGSTVAHMQMTADLLAVTFWLDRTGCAENLFYRYALLRSAANHFYDRDAILAADPDEYSNLFPWLRDMQETLRRQEEGPAEKGKIGRAFE
jgi:hypothetical protein